LLSQSLNSTMEYNPFHGRIDVKVVEALEKIGFKRDKYRPDHWRRRKWYWPFSYELVILGLMSNLWMYDNGHGTRYWSTAHDDLFDCIAKGWI
jgi:hypothetical protein